MGNRTRDLPACSIVPQPTTLPRTPVAKVMTVNKVRTWVKFIYREIHKSRKQTYLKGDSCLWTGKGTAVACLNPSIWMQSLKEILKFSPRKESCDVVDSALYTPHSYFSVSCSLSVSSAVHTKRANLRTQYSSYSCASQYATLLRFLPHLRLHFSTFHVGWGSRNWNN
jgi:hypothetical protein